METRTRKFVSEKGCLNRYLKPTEVCVNLGELQDRATGKRMFYCSREFPEDCSKYGCPKMIRIDKEWLKGLRKINQYE